MAWISLQLAAMGCLRRSFVLVIGVVLTCASLGFAREKAITPELSKIGDGKRWSVIHADASAAVEMGQSVVRMKPWGDPQVGSNIGLALVDGVEFAEGTLEIDLKGNGKQEASFLGVAFNVADARTFEAIYFRPFRFMSDDVASRAHAVQYVAWPSYTWEKLRKEKPGVYESAVKPVPDPSGWFHARIEVTKRKV